MKKPALILLVLAMLASTLWGTVASGLTQIPHENPATAESRDNIALLMLHYADIFDLVASGKYLESRDMIEQLKPDYAHLPEELKFIMSRLNDLLADLTDGLDNLDAVLDECESLLSQNELNEASWKITEARGLSAEIGSLVGNVDAATDEMLLQAAAFISPQEAARVQAAKARLQEELDRLARLEDQYRALQESIETEAEEKEALSVTDLTLHVSQSRAWVGENLAVSGVLKADGVPLVARDVSLHLRGRHVATVTTRGDGYYAASFALPYWWYDIDEVAVQTFYHPRGEDGGSFTAASSEETVISVLSYPSSLQLEVPGEIYPGSPVNIRGKVNSGGNVAGRDVRALMEGELLFQTFTDDNGYFQHDVVLGDESHQGKHRMYFIVAPDNESCSAGVLAFSSVDVLKAKPEITMRAPGVIFLPRRFELTGEVHSPLPLHEAQAILEVAGASTTATLNEGDFSMEMDLPFSFSRAGPEEVKLSLVPTEPWQLPSECTVKIFVINLAYLLAVVAVLLALAVVGLSMRRFHGSWRRKGELPATAEDSREPLREEDIWSPETGPVVEENRGIILKAYYAAAAWVQKVAGVLFSPQMTLREFLHQVISPHSRFAGALARLTGLAERALYSRHVQGKDEASLARDLSAQVKKQGRRERET